MLPVRRGQVAGDGGDDGLDEASLRAAAEAGDPDRAYELGRALVDQERFEDAEPWLRRAAHSDHAGTAASLLAHVLTEQDRGDEAEGWWVAAAAAGDLDAAYNLAAILESSDRPDESAHWYRRVAGSDSFVAVDAAHRLAVRRVDDEARRLARQGDRRGLWDLILSVPVVDAVDAARHLGDWAPPDSAGRALAARLRAGDIPTVAHTVADRAAVLTTRIVRQPLDVARATELAGEGLLVLALSDHSRATADPGGAEHRVVTVDPAGVETEVYAGPRSHSSIACLGRESLVVVRDASESDGRGGYDLRWEIVRYQPGGELVLAEGVGAPMPRVVATEHGYVVGLMLTSKVIVGSLVDPPRIVDLASVGLRHRTVLLAVDPTGTRVVFGDDHVLAVTDGPIERRVASASGPADVHGHLVDLTFVGPDSIVTSGDRGLCRWSIDGDVMRPVVSAGTAAPVRDLFSVPSAGIVGGNVQGGRTAYFDAGTLTLIAPPRTIAGRQSAWAASRAAAAPGGRFLVYSGQLLADDSRFDRSYDAVTAIHDLHHPLSWLNRPPATFTDADRRALADLLARPADAGGQGGAAGSDQVLAPDERQVLELVQAAAEHRQRTRSTR